MTLKNWTAVAHSQQPAYWPSNDNKKCDPEFRIRHLTAETITGVVSLVYYLHCESVPQTKGILCMTIEELTAKIWPCERKKMQLILIGKLDNISIKLVA